MSTMKARFQIAECSLSSANLHKILRILHQFDKKVETTAHFYLKVSANCTFFTNFIAEFSFHGVS